MITMAAFNPSRQIGALSGATRVISADSQYFCLLARYDERIQTKGGRAGHGPDQKYTLLADYQEPSAVGFQNVRCNVIWGRARALPRDANTGIGGVVAGSLISKIRERGDIACAMCERKGSNCDEYDQRAGAESTKSVRPVRDRP